MPASLEVSTLLGAVCLEWFTSDLLIFVTTKRTQGTLNLVFTLLRSLRHKLLIAGHVLMSESQVVLIGQLKLDCNGQHGDGGNM